MISMETIEDKIKLLRELLKKKDFSEARIEAEKLVYIHSANAELNYLMGFIYDKLNLLNRAEEAMRQAKQQDSLAVTL